MRRRIRKIVADQKVIRTNNDSLYSLAVIDVRDGAAITVPQMHGRYFSIAIIDMFHFTEQIITTPGTHKIKADSDYVIALLRTGADNMNQGDIDHVVNNVQPNFTINAQSAVPFVKGDIDIENMLAARKEIVEQGMKEQSLADMMGPRGKVDDWRHLMGTAMAWGLLPDREASYKVVNPKLADNQCYSATFAEPENEGFWSITMYDKQGFLYSDDNGILNGYNRQTNKDGTTTVHFGSVENCGKYAVNRLDVTDGWNFLLRVYRPDLDDFHNYQLPEFVKI